MKRPLSDKRPVGPFAQIESTEEKLMVGFPVELPRGDMERTDDPLSQIQEEVARMFNTSRGMIKVDDVNLSGFNPPVVKFISFPVADPMKTETARNIGEFPKRINRITNEVLGEDLNANVSIWVGDIRSGSQIS